MESKLTKLQSKEFRIEYLAGDGRQCVIAATVRYDDQCGNGHNSFSLTGAVFDRGYTSGEDYVINSKGQKVYLGSCGCIHEDIRSHFPGLSEYIKWHSCTSEGPLYYVENTKYHAGDRDGNGLRKGETRQLRKGAGKLSWILEHDVVLPQYVDSDEQPTETATARYVPWCRVGEGKDRALDAARRCAIWPEATDEELCADPKDLEKALLNRLPALMVEFKDAIEEFDFTF